MNVIDLSHLITDGMQIYPGDPAPTIQRFLEHDKDYCHVDRLNLGSHTGTHIDAPYHFLKGGKRITDFQAERFVGNGVILDVTHLEENEPISLEHMTTIKARLKPGCFVLIHTGWDRYFGEEKYLRHPYLSKEAAEFLAESGVGLIGTDGLNIDSTVNEIFDAHDVLLSRDILIVENIANLHQVPKEGKGFFSFLPLKLDNTDGSPVRGVYIEL